MLKSKKWLGTLLLVMLMVLTLIPVQVFADGTYTPVEGMSLVVSGSSSSTEENGSYTVTAKGSAGFLGMGASAKTATITIYNNLTTSATVSFDWTATSVNQLTIDGTVYSGTSGSFSKVLDAGGSFIVTVVTAKNATVNTLVMSNFAVVAAADASNVTVTYDSAMGNVSAADSIITSGAVVEGVTVAEGVALAATPNSGYTFLGWINADNNQVIDRNASFTFLPTENTSIEAVFVSSAATAVPYYLAGGDHIYNSLADATAYASSANSKVVVLLNNATLPAGNYTIPSGVTLLIPFDAANTLYTAVPGNVGDAYTTPSVYRTLTMASGANITINGALSVSGKHSAKLRYNGMPSGPQGFIKMNSDSSITVNSGAFLYAWGYIYGSGSVTANSGGTVYECFQIADYRGGDATSQLQDNDKDLFPMSQYYLQNIEVPLKLMAGAEEYGYMTVTVTMVGQVGEDITIIGNSNSMFIVENGYITKDYMEGTGRLKFETSGDISVSPISLSMDAGNFGGNITIDSAKFNLPIASHMTVKAISGNISINQDIMLQPGSELIVDEGVVCKLGTGNRVIVYDLDQWGTYCGSTNLRNVPVAYAPGGLGTTGREKDAMIEINGTVDASAGAVYTTAGGANIYSTGNGKVITKAGTETETYQIKRQYKETLSQEFEWDTISIVPAMAKNADGSYLSTADATESSEYNYNAEHGKWVKGKHTISSVVTAPTCTTAGYTTHTCLCGYSYTDSEVAATGHSWTAWSQTKAPTCTEEGVETRTCTVAGCGATETQSVPALGHTWVDADCTTPKTCSVCDATEGEALGHSWGDWTEEVAPTCTATGKEVRTCGSCGATEAQDIEPLEHNYSSVVTAPTCTAEGYTTHTCGRCNDVYTDSETPATGHAYDAVITAPTCTTAGYTTYTCQNAGCGHSYVGDETAALGHTEVIDAAVAATCTTAGKTEGKHCSVCKEVLVAQETVAALGHTEVIDAAVAATCTETGLTEGKHCSVCKAVLVAQTEVAALGHTEVIDAAVSATLSNTGLTEGKHCSVCKAVLVAQEETAALMKADWSMTLSDDLSVNFYIDVDSSVAANTKITVSFNSTETVYNAGNAISVKVAATQMNDVITVTVANGEDVVTKAYTVKQYADAILADAAMSEYHGIAQAMLNYGGAAQTYFGYNKDNLVSAEIVNVELPEVADMVVEGSAEGIRFYGATLVYREKIAVRFYFTGSSEGVEGAVTKGDLFYVEVADILPQDLDQAVTVTIGGLSVSYSPMNYIVRMNGKGDESLQNLMKALYSYHVAAQALAA